MVAYRRPMAWTLCATRRGSSRSSGSGRPVSIWQKSRPRGRAALPPPPGLARARRLGGAGVDLAEVAARGALAPADEERGLPVLPALVDVGAAGLLADRVQALALDQCLELEIFRPRPGPGLDPLGLALDRGLRIALLDAEQAAPVRRAGANGSHDASAYARAGAHRGVMRHPDSRPRRTAPGGAS